jgi:uncharacterized protein (TIGR02186 family)
VIRIGFLFAALLMLTAAREPILVPEVSQHEIQVQQGFTGTNLLLFGAVLDPAGTRAARGYDIVVVLKGPTEAVRIREKSRIGGIWVNADSTDFRSAPSFFAVAASRPVKDIVDDRTAAIYELGNDYIQLSPSGTINPEEQVRFTSGLVDLKRRKGLYKEDMHGVKLSGGVLYQARIALPSSVQTGTYTAETFAISDGRVVSSAIAKVDVRKVGFERFIEVFAQIWSFWYGLLAVALSTAMGWIAGRLFAMG